MTSNLLLICFLASIGVFAYLTYHHYMVKMGLTGSSLCQINSTLNCDTAALSKYAEILTIPIAVLGLSYSIVMLSFFGFARLGWVEESETFKSITKTLTSLSALGSVVLLAISITQLKTYCPFCIAGYILSFAIVFLTYSLYSESKFSLKPSSLIAEKGLVISLLVIPVLSWFISGSIRDNYGLGEIEKIIPEKIYHWQNGPSYSFDTQVGLVKGNMDAAAPTIVEFADFKCPHCKTASMTLKTFISGNPKVKMIYKPYPLDGVCNPHISQKGDGSRCELAGIALCSEKLFQKGWDVHYWIFDKQESLFQVSDLTDTVREIASEFSLDVDKLKQCATSAETYAEIAKSANEGDMAKITGTPTIFVNGKKLEYGQFIDVLRAAINSL
ncbi:MAG: vitamin K epoxide reductase family protein [Pseudobdellovibrio sp.]